MALVIQMLRKRGKTIVSIPDHEKGIIIHLKPQTSGELVLPGDGYTRVTFEEEFGLSPALPGAETGDPLPVATATVGPNQGIAMPKDAQDNTESYRTMASDPPPVEMGTDPKAQPSMTGRPGAGELHRRIQRVPKKEAWA